MHKNVKRFTYEGVVGDDSSIPRTRENYERMMLDEMADTGYAFLLDLGTYWSTKYYPREDVYEFKLTAYGVYVGKVKSCQTDGILHGRLLPSDTHQTKQQP